VTLRYACARVIGKEDLSNCECSFDKISPALTPDEIDDILDSASDALAQITSLPVGRCTTVYRPCLDRCHYVGCGCGCAPNGIPLPGVAPTVTAVKIDGAVISPTTYTVLKTSGGIRSLERFLPTGAPDTWPATQSLRLPDTAPGTFSITVESGNHPDPIMRLAAAEIGCDILRTIANERDTPEGIQSATVYSETVAYQRFGDPTDQQTMNLAGLGQVRRFIAAAGAIRYGAFTSNDLLRGWTLYVRE
jgi:hypothetical protein